MEEFGSRSLDVEAHSRDGKIGFVASQVFRFDQLLDQHDGRIGTGNCSAVNEQSSGQDVTIFKFKKF